MRYYEAIHALRVSWQPLAPSIGCGDGSLHRARFARFARLFSRHRSATCLCENGKPIRAMGLPHSQGEGSGLAFPERPELPGETWLCQTGLARGL